MKVTMPRQVGLLTTLMGLVALTASAQNETGSVNTIIPYPTHERTLPNGLKVILMPMPSNGLVAYWTIVRTGSRDEYEPGRTGFAHFFEHMMFRGTERFPAAEYQRRLTSMGADVNAYTSDDLTAYHIAMTSADLEEVMLLESDRFQNLSYSESDFATEAGAVYGEYRKNRTDPFFVLYEAMMETAFEKHTYGHTTLGYEKDIAAMPQMYDYSRSFFSRYYRPDNTVLFIAGDIDPAATMGLVERYYGQWQAGYVPPMVPAEPVQEEERFVDVEYDGQTLPILWIAYKLDAFDPRSPSRTRVAADFLTSLAFGETSETYRRLVLDEQVVEFLEADTNLNRDPSLIDIYTRVKDPDKVAYVRDVIDETIAQYRDFAPDPERVDALKSRFKYGFLMGLETPNDVAARLARHIAIAGGLEGINRLYAMYAEITPEDVRRAANAYFVETRRTVGMLRAQR